MMEGEYGIVANVVETDRIFRNGAKAWIADGTGGEGWERFKWIAHSRGGRIIEKWAPTVRFAQFRAKWIPEHLRDRICYLRGTREEMETLAKQLCEDADRQRTEHPNRRGLRALS
jgi:hypothetical protein